MKQILIIIGSIMLGLYIFGMLLGDNPESVKASSQTVFERLVEDVKTTP